MWPYPQREPRVVQDALNEFADSEDVMVEWITKSYEYNLSKETQRMCDKEMAEVTFGMI